MPRRRSALFVMLAAGVFAPLIRGASAEAAPATALAGSNVNALASFGGRIWAGTDSGLYVLGAGASAWTAVGGPFGGREVNALAVSGAWLVVGTGDGAVRTSDGSNWSSGGLAGERVASLSAVGSTLLAGTGHDQSTDGVVQRSDDSGATWTAAPVAPAAAGLPGETVQAVLAPVSGSAAWAGTAGGGVLRSADGRGGWSGTVGMRSSWVTALWHDPGAAGRVLAGSDDGLYAWSGSSWTAAGFPEPDPWVQALATGGDGRALAGTYDGEVYAQGAGGAWTLRASGLPSVLALLAVSGGGVLVGTTDGVACTGCPASIAAAASPAAGRATPARSLPPPGVRAGTSAQPGGSGAGTGGVTAVASPRAGVGAGVDGVGRAGTGMALPWLIAGVLVVLASAAMLLRRGVLQRRGPGPGG